MHLIKRLFLISWMFFGCKEQHEEHWEHAKINSTLRNLFPEADSIIVLDSPEAAKDQRDAVHLPSPVYKALIKKKGAALYQCVIYFYEGDLTDTAFFIPVIKSITIHDLRVGLGTNKPDYFLPLPYFDSVGSSKMLVLALSAPEASDSLYLGNKIKIMLQTFGLKVTKTHSNGDK